MEVNRLNLKLLNLSGLKFYKIYAHSLPDDLIIIKGSADLSSDLCRNPVNNAWAMIDAFTMAITKAGSSTSCRMPGLGHIDVKEGPRPQTGPRYPSALCSSIDFAAFLLIFLNEKNFRVVTITPVAEQLEA